MSVKDMVNDHEKRITVMAKALHCLKLEVRDLENWVREKNKIVRCKDCVHWRGQGYCSRFDLKNMWPIATDGTMYMPMDADDFCSRGEKKDGLV